MFQACLTAGVVTARGHRVVEVRGVVTRAAGTPRTIGDFAFAAVVPESVAVRTLRDGGSCLNTGQCAAPVEGADDNSLFRDKFGGLAVVVPDEHVEWSRHRVLVDAGAPVGGRRVLVRDHVRSNVGSTHPDVLEDGGNVELPHLPRRHGLTIDAHAVVIERHLLRAGLDLEACHSSVFEDRYGSGSRDRGEDEFLDLQSVAAPSVRQPVHELGLRWAREGQGS